MADASDLPMDDVAGVADRLSGAAKPTRRRGKRGPSAAAAAVPDQPTRDEPTDPPAAGDTQPARRRSKRGPRPNDDAAETADQPADTDAAKPAKRRAKRGPSANATSDQPDADQPTDGDARPAKRKGKRGPRANHEQKLIAELRRRIYDGEWPHGMKLPSQKKLENKNGRSTQTVRLAIIALENEGLVSKSQGRLTTVTLGEPTHPLTVGPSTGVGDRVAEPALSFGGDSATGEHHERTERTTTMPLRLAAPVGLEFGTAVVERTTSVTVDDELVALSISYLPPELAAADDGDAWHAADIGQLAVVGHTLAPEPLTGRCRMPDPDERALLRVGKGVPMLILSRRYTVGEDGVRAAVVVLARADRVFLNLDS